MTKEGFIFPLPFILIAGIFMFLFGKYGEFSYAYLSTFFFFLGMVIMLFFRDPDGYCPHLNRQTLQCEVWEARPLRCRRYDRRKDREIWPQGFPNSND